MGYVLVPTVLGGAHEWMAHLTQLVLVWIAVVAMTSLIFQVRMGPVARNHRRPAPFGRHSSLSPHG